jgi:hypothetical protein
MKLENHNDSMDALDMAAKTTQWVTKYCPISEGKDWIFHTDPSINHINYLPIRASEQLPWVIFDT